MNWINVNDRMPEVESASNCSSESVSEEVVVLIGDETLIASFTTGTEDGGWENWYCRAYEDSVENVTHWLELPEKPSD